CVKHRAGSISEEACRNSILVANAEGGSASPEDDGKQSPDGANIGRLSRSAVCRRVEDNAFHLAYERGTTTSQAQPARKQRPPIGVITTSQRRLVSAMIYKLPLK